MLCQANGIEKTKLLGDLPPPPTPDQKRGQLWNRQEVRHRYALAVLPTDDEDHKKKTSKFRRLFRARPKTMAAVAIIVAMIFVWCLVDLALGKNVFDTAPSFFG